jgi:hypothetical protein
VKYKTQNDLMYAIAERAEELADKPLDELRSIAGYGCSSRADAVKTHKGKRRGELLGMILTTEFFEDDGEMARAYGGKKEVAGETPSTPDGAGVRAETGEDVQGAQPGADDGAGEVSGGGAGAAGVPPQEG